MSKVDEIYNRTFRENTWLDNTYQSLAFSRLLKQALQELAEHYEQESLDKFLSWIYNRIEEDKQCLTLNAPLTTSQYMAVNDAVVKFKQQIEGEQGD